ncbi:MAG: hypothetical protein OXC40_02995 [Proteobacteria bacterium]|nr:hypothetical protein [Pseudomonadota bacterium]
MNSLSNTFDFLKSRIYQIGDKISVVVFGMNNERLDFLIDSFQKLRPREQKLMLAGGLFMILFFVVFASLLYIKGVNGLRQELYDSLQAHRKFNGLMTEYQVANSKFESVLRDVGKKSKNISGFKSYFEKISKEMDVSLASLGEKIVPLNDSDLFHTEINTVKVDVVMDNISLPKMIKYLSALEKGEQYLRVSHLSIRARYETKLYFDTKVSVRGYLTK